MSVVGVFMAAGTRAAATRMLAVALMACGGESAHNGDAASGADSVDSPIAPTCPSQLAPPPSTQCATPWFAGRLTPNPQAPAAYSGSLFAGQIALGDFNADGVPDAVVSNNGDSVSVFMAASAGVFATPTVYAVPGQTLDVAVGDLDGNGSKDIVSVATPVGGGPGGIGLLLNNGTGTFGATTSLTSVGNGLTSVALADTNRDGLLDIVVPWWGSNQGGIEVFLNQGNAAFSAPRRYSTSVPDSPRDVAVADLDGDGATDVVAVSDTLVVVSRGRANGFAPSVSYESGFRPHAVTLDDLNDDGRSDVIVSGYRDVASAPGAIAVLMNSGNGQLSAPALYPTTGRPNGAISGDIDGDGDLDVVVANWDPRDGTSIFLNAGNGSLGGERIEDTGPKTSVALADLDVDGRLDLIGSEGYMVAYLGRGDGTFDVGAQSPVARPISIRDVNNDGHSDLFGWDSSDIRLAVSLALGNGSFAPPTTFCATCLFRDFKFADLDGDGIEDIAAVSYGNHSPTSTLITLKGHADGSFTIWQRVSTTGADAWALAIADVSGDCKLDIVVSNPGYGPDWRGEAYAGSTDLLINDGIGGFGAAIKISTASSRIAAGDVTSDGWVDVVAEQREEGIRLLRNAGAGVFAPEELIGNSALVALADLDHDQRLDLVASSIQLGLGDGTFGPSLSSPAPTEWLNDMNGDGNLDGVKNSTARNQGEILFGLGDGTFSSSCCWNNLGPSGHLDGDGLVDFASSRLLHQRCY